MFVHILSVYLSLAGGDRFILFRYICATGTAPPVSLLLFLAAIIRFRAAIQ
jgi:hypothetical protein